MIVMIMVFSASSLSRMQQTVAQKEHTTTGPLYNSTSHMLRSRKSRSGINGIVKDYWVSNSTQRTVQCFCRLDLTGLLTVARPTRCILKMESESSATNREATPNTSIMPGTATSSWSSGVWSDQLYWRSEWFCVMGVQGFILLSLFGILPVLL